MTAIPPLRKRPRNPDRRLWLLPGIILLVAPAAGAETIRIGIGVQDATINCAHGGALVRELKLFEKHLPRTGKYAGTQYEIVWKNFTSGPPLNGEMLAGKLDIGALGDFPAVLNGVSFAAKGIRSVYVAALSGSAVGAGNGLVVPVGSTAQSLADLKGKQISVPFGSAAHGMLLRAVRDLGWNPDSDVNLVSQSPEVGGTALRAGKIDAHADFVPFAELFAFRGFARKIYDGSTVKVPTFHGLVARGEFVDQHPDLVVAYLKAVLEADRLFAAEPERHAELVHKVAGIDAEVVYMFHGPNGIQTRDLTLKPEVRKSLEVALETLTLLKRTDGKLDLARWMDDRFLRQAAKESGLDYEARLKRRDPLPFPEEDAGTGHKLGEARQVGEIWVQGESKVRRYGAVAATLAAAAALGKQGRRTRVVLVHDSETSMKLLADKAWYVIEGSPKPAKAKGQGPTMAAFLTRAAAEAWVRSGKAKAKPGSTPRVEPFDAAKSAAVIAAAEDTGAAPAAGRARASLP
jgi:NitT/TauT family transport system substrate-binding protein